MNTQTAGACPFELAELPITDEEFEDFAEQHHGYEVDWPERREPPKWMYDYISEGNVIRFKRLMVTIFNDATIIGDLDAAHVDALLNAPAIVATSDIAPRVAADKWRQLTGTWANVVEVLSTHPERADKGGHALFFAESATTGKTVNGVKLCHKLKASIRRVFAVAIDVDGGCTVEQVIERIRAMGIFAVVYTTHSHTTKGGPGSDRFRVIILLSEPFDMGTGADRDARAAEWVGRYVGLCNTIVPAGGDWDFTASRPSQLMYAPARPKGAAYKHYIVAGGGLDLSTVPLGDATPYRKRGPSGGVRGAAHDGEPAILSDGFDLLAWHADHGGDFLLSVFLETIGWDVLGDAGGGFEILCPNAAAHSVGTGETAWALDGPDAKNGATIYCHHAHCTDLRTCDFIRMLEDRCPDLPDGYETFSVLMCDAMMYPDTVDGVPVEVNRGDYVEEVITIDWLKTPAAVKRAFGALDDRSSRDAHAALYAGVAKGGGKPAVAAILSELIKESRRFSANDVKALEARGKELLKANNAAHAARKQEERRADTPAHAGGMDADADYMARNHYIAASIAKTNATTPHFFQYMEQYAVADSVRGRIRVLDAGPFNTEVQKVAPFVEFRGEACVGVAAPGENVYFSFNDAGLRDALPPLDDVFTTPFFARDGSLVNEIGYHPGARVYLAPTDLHVRRVSAAPTPEEVANAVRFIVEEALADFPMAGLAREQIMEQAFTESGVPAVTHSLALILLPFARNMIAGPTPGHIINKPAPGTGAGFLTDVCSIIATGAATPPMAMPANKDEMAKTLTAALMDNQKILFRDNINHSMDSGELASAMTAPEEGYKARILGKSQTALVRIMAAWVFAANTLTMSSELLRRCALIDLNRNVPNPDLWKPEGGYRHADVRAWVREHRGEFVHACLTIIQNWVAGGMIKQTEESLASFENWAGVMGGILKAAGVGGFMGNREELTGLSDGRDDELAEVAQALADKMGKAQEDADKMGRGVKVRLYIGSKTDKENKLGMIGLFDVLHAMTTTPRLEHWSYIERLTDAGMVIEYHNTKKAGIRFRGAAKRTFRVRVGGADCNVRFVVEKDAVANVNCYRMDVVQAP